MKMDRKVVSLTSKSIAIVDDNAEFCLLLERFLHAKGYDVIIFNSSLSFLNGSSAQFDIVLLDLFMPDPDGITVLRQLAQCNFSGAIVLISGEDDGVLRAALELSKAQGLSNVVSLKKPFALESLLSFVEQSLLVQSTLVPRQQTSWQPDLPALAVAIELQQLQLYYQPKIGLATNELIGFEALVRWIHPDHGLIMPDYFIPLAEQSMSMMHALTSEVIRLAILQLSVWQQLGKQVVISINVSMMNLVALDFPEWLQQQLHENQLLTEQLHLEVTETALMSEVANALDILVRLKMKGFILSIDDFGTGYSSLAQLHRIPFAELKIDKSFVLSMQANEESTTIVETCIFLGKRLGLRIIAEGIEDEQTARQLLKMGCHSGQGFYWSKAVPAAEATAWLLP